MRVIMVMFDSLNRHYLPPYGCDWTIAPNFSRLAKRCATFDKSYVCSMPCMPARRDLHTGRPNFLHTGWGPIEPFDDSMPQMLSQAGIYTHLITDHYHYFEDGGATFHGRYNSYEFYRGQEGDPFVGQVRDPHVPKNINGKGRRQDWVNREHIQSDEQYPQTQTFQAGLRFIEQNQGQDNWFLQIECFDPHEPFNTHRRYRDLYPREYDGPLFDWPGYEKATQSEEELTDLRRNYASLLTKCDESLGNILDAMDQNDMWKDTMLVVWTDHGFLLGEHGCLAKNWPPLFEEVSHTPLFVYDPRTPECAGARRSSLVQPAIDLAPTMLRFFGLQPTEHMLGHDLGPVIHSDHKVRDAAIFGYHGNRVNVTDGRYVYYKRPRPNQPGDCNRYTLLPVNMRGFVRGDALKNATQHPPFAFTKGVPTLKIAADSGTAAQDDWPDLLYDLAEDPAQQSPLTDPTTAARLQAHMQELMRACDAPPEQFRRMQLS